MGEHAWVLHFWADESGATAIEYGLICAIISTCLIAIAATGGALDIMYDKMNSVIEALN